jgi:hypothetical protein
LIFDAAERENRKRNPAEGVLAAINGVHDEDTDLAPLMCFVMIIPS